MDQRDKTINYLLDQADRDGLFRPKTSKKIGLGTILTSRGPIEAAVLGTASYLGSRKVANANLESANIKKSSDMYTQDLSSWTQRHNKNLDLLANRGLIGKVAGAIGLLTDKKPDISKYDFSAGQPVKTETKVIGSVDPREIEAEQRTQTTLDSVQNYVKPVVGEKTSQWVRRLAERNIEED